MLEYPYMVAMSPLWLAQLPTSAKSFEKNAIIGCCSLNERGLHVTRVRLAHRAAASRRRRLEHLIALEDRAAFERDGFVLRRNVLPGASFARLLDQVHAYRGIAREKREGDTLLRKIVLTPAALRRMPALAELLALPAWAGTIRYVGTHDVAPKVYLQSIRRHACDGPADPQTALHADTFHPTVKAWFFLTDVAADAGAFTYVPGSHRLTPARLAWERRMSLEAARSPDRQTREGSFRIDPTALAGLGLPAPAPLAVPANSMIVADTFGFHARGSSRGPSLRVEVWAYGRRSPFVPLSLIHRPAGWAIAAANAAWWAATAPRAPASGPGAALVPEHYRSRAGASAFDG